MRTRILAATAVATLLGLPARARAEGDEGYGWQIAAVDVAAVGAGSLGLLRTSSAALPVTGLVAFAVGGPVIHALHGNGGRAGLSVMMRMLLPPLAAAGGAVVGLGLARGGSDVSTNNDLGWFFGGAAAGLGVGMLGVSALDTFWNTPRSERPVALLVGRDRITLAAAF